MTQPSSTWFRVRRRLLGLVFLLVLAMLVQLSVAIYNKRFRPVAMVTLYTSSVGNQMHPRADVKVRGVVVGEVRQISTGGGDRAKLLLAIRQGMVEKLPANMSAVLLPTTLFGQRYVSLTKPRNPAPQRLDDGSVIRQKRSRSAIELQQALNNLLPTLRAVQPQKLSATLNAVAQALRGRGEELGDTLTQLESYLEELNPHLPALNEDIAKLVEVSRIYDRAAPDIIAALDDLTTTTRTIVDQRRNLNALYATLTGASQELAGFLRQNEGNIIRLSAHSKPTLRLLARYSPEFPCTLRALTEFKPVMDRVLGKGTDEPGLHVTVDTVPSQGRYVPGEDAPVYDAGGGPRCPYSVRFAHAAADDVEPPAERATKTSLVGRGALGPANSPQETRLINELLAPALRVPQRSLPGWSGVLVGPLFRGTEVTIE